MKLNMRNLIFLTDYQNLLLVIMYWPKTDRNRFLAVSSLKLFTSWLKERSKKFLMYNDPCLISSPEKKSLKKMITILIN